MGRLRPRLSPLLMPWLDTIEDTAMEVTAMVDTVVAMAATVDTTARGLLMPRPLLMLSPAMVTTAMDMVMDTAMVAATDTTARGLLMLRLSPLLMPNLAMVMAM